MTGDYNGLKYREMSEAERTRVFECGSALNGLPVTLVLSILTHLLAGVLLDMSGGDDEVFDENLRRATEAIKGNKTFIQAAGATKQ